MLMHFFDVSSSCKHKKVACKKTMFLSKQKRLLSLSGLFFSDHGTCSWLTNLDRFGKTDFNFWKFNIASFFCEFLVKHMWVCFLGPLHLEDVVHVSIVSNLRMIVIFNASDLIVTFSCVGFRHAMHYCATLCCIALYWIGSVFYCNSLELEESSISIELEEPSIASYTISTTMLTAIFFSPREFSAGTKDQCFRAR